MTNQMLIGFVVSSFGVLALVARASRRELEKARARRLAAMDRIDKATAHTLAAVEKANQDCFKAGLKTLEDYKAKFPGSPGSVKQVQKFTVVSWVDKGFEHFAPFKFDAAKSPWQPEFDVVTWRGLDGVVFKVPRVTSEKVRAAGGDPTRN